MTEAEDAMWAWYLEWPEIARTAIKDRALLRRLGFLATTVLRRRSTTEPGEEADDAVRPA